MTPDRFRTILQALDWSIRGLATYLGIGYPSVMRWSTGATLIPPHVATWLETLAAVHERHPLPDGWEKRQ